MSKTSKKTPATKESPPKQKRPQGRIRTLADGTVVKVNNNNVNRVDEGRTSKHYIKASKKYSTEHDRDYEDYEVKDDYDSLEYPPPSKNPVFRKFWADTIGALSARENFNESHLGLLEAYCRIRVELRALDAFIATHGHTYRTVSLLGEIRKTYPEVNERLRILTQLGNYSRMLDFLPKKDKKLATKKKESEEWE